MTQADQYEELRRFLSSPLWTEVLKPRLQAWRDNHAAGIMTAQTPAALWDARIAATTAAQALPLIDNALDELKRELAEELKPPVRAT